MRPFLVNRFFKESPKDVPKDMEGFFPCFGAFSSFADSFSCPSSSFVSGLESPVITPSSIRIIRVEYRVARSGL